MTWHNVEKLDKLDVLIGLAIKDLVDEETERYMNADVSGITFSNSYYRRKRQVINRHMMRKHIAVVKKVASRVAIVILCILSAAFITVMSVSALRNAIWDAIVEWYDDYISIRFEAPVADSNDTEYSDSVHDENPVIVSPPTEILEYRKPMYIPEGVEEVVVLQSKGAYIIDYYIGDELQYSYKQGLLNDDNKRVNNEDSIVYEIYVDQKKVTIFESENSLETILVWEDGEYTYIFTSYITLDKLIEIVQSIG